MHNARVLDAFHVAGALAAVAVPIAATAMAALVGRRTQTSEDHYRQELDLSRDEAYLRVLERLKQSVDRVRASSDYETRDEVDRRLHEVDAMLGVVRERVDEKPEPEDPQRQLSLSYHAQGLAQAKTSFYVSLVFASLGFAIILAGVVIAILAPSGVAETRAAVVSVISGVITDATAALFFVQTNRARAHMSTLFDSLREDRKLEREYFKALDLVEAIGNPEARDAHRAALARHFVGLPGSQDLESV